MQFGRYWEVSRVPRALVEAEDAQLSCREPSAHCHATWLEPNLTSRQRCNVRPPLRYPRRVLGVLQPPVWVRAGFSLHTGRTAHKGRCGLAVRVEAGHEAGPWLRP